MVSGSKESENSDAEDVLYRHVRSNRDLVNGLVSMEGSENIPSLTRTQSATSLSSRSSRKRGLTVGDRLRRLSQELPLKLRGNSKSEPASPRVNAAEVGDIAAPDVATRHGKMLSIVDEHVEGSLVGTDSSSTNPDDHSLSPTTLLAQRLRDLIDPLPFPSFSYPIKPPKLPPRDKKGCPIPPKSSSPINDAKLIELLSSATFMNGSRSGDKPHPSIWALLEGLGVPPHGFPEGQSVEPDNRGGDDEQPVDNQPGYAGTSSVMVYSPLIPGKNDIVELGELIPVSVEEVAMQDAAANKSWASIWPLSLLPHWTQSTQAPVMEIPPSVDFSGDFIIHSDVTNIDISGRKFRVKTTSAWVPSTTKMSFQAMWWGYRLWLPPPVMAVLSDRSLEAAKRASLIATALAWFFNNLPVNLFPPHVRPALLLMQRIVPYLGYIATFISWSWGAIKSYDIGHGVTLTATWLLPFALIPGTWYENDVPTSPQSPPTTIPGSSPTTTPPRPPVDNPKGPPATSPPTTSPTPTQPSQTGDPPSQPAPGKSPSSPLPQQPTVPLPGTDDPIISPPTDPQIPDPVSVYSPRPFAKKLFALSPTKMGAAGPSEPSPAFIRSVQMPKTPIQAGSTLGEELLHAPALRSIPLPDESIETLIVMNKKRKEKQKSPLFHRIRK